jgi:hypothetical protein
MTVTGRAFDRVEPPPRPAEELLHKAKWMAVVEQSISLNLSSHPM